ncbi:hypothetical protein [Sphingobacterium corticibacter]|nr:hypothetical protein [Sphingobacterium corticibacter]
MIYRHLYRFFLSCCYPIRLSALSSCLVFTLLFSISPAQAQQPAQRYEGRYRLLDSITGTAIYDYIMLEGDTVKNGNFRFQQFIEHYQDSDTIHGFVLDGPFTRNVKNGAWRFVSRDFTVSGNPQALDARVVYNVTGEESLLKTTFKSGTVDGRYELLDRKLVDSDAADTTYYAQLSYQMGQPRGTLQGFAPQLQTQGQFDEEGFPHGDWRFTHAQDSAADIIEIRRYDHGFFSKHFYEIDQERYEISHIGFDTLVRSGQGLLTRLPVTSTYFRALEYTELVMDTTALTGLFTDGNLQILLSRSNQFMERVLANPASYRGKNVWQRVEGSKIINPIRIKIRKFPFSDEEKRLNIANEKLLRETRLIIANFLDNPAVQTGRFSQLELARSFAAFRIYESRLTALAPSIAFLVDEAAEYVDHHAILNRKKLALRYPDTISYEYKNANATYSYAFPSSLTNYDVAAINQHLTEVFDDVQRVVQTSGAFLSNVMAQGELTGKEERLIDLRDSVIQLFSDQELTETFTTLHQRFSEPTNLALESTFRDYSLLSVQDRLLAIDSLLSCYQTYAGLHATLANLQQRIDELDAEYTRSIWNAYTYTYMEERVKERLYTIYNDQLMPYLLTALEQNLNCDTLSASLTRIYSLLDRMMELRMEDTRQLERQLRRAPKDPERYLEIIINNAVNEG